MGFAQIARQHTVDFNDDLVVALCENYGVNKGASVADIQLYVQWTTGHCLLILKHHDQEF